MPVDTVGFVCACVCGCGCGGVYVCGGVDGECVCVDGLHSGPSCLDSEHFTL